MLPSGDWASIAGDDFGGVGDNALNPSLPKNKSELFSEHLLRCRINFSCKLFISM